MLWHKIRMAVKINFKNVPLTFIKETRLGLT